MKSGLREGALGIVIGKTARAVNEADAPGHIFGYIWINEVTASDIINRDPAFPQWSRAKSSTLSGVISMKPGSTIEITIEITIEGPGESFLLGHARQIKLRGQGFPLFPHVTFV